MHNRARLLACDVATLHPFRRPGASPPRTPAPLFGSPSCSTHDVDPFCQQQLPAPSACPSGAADGEPGGSNDPGGGAGACACGSTACGAWHPKPSLRVPRMFERDLKKFNPPCCTPPRDVIRSAIRPTRQPRCAGASVGVGRFAWCMCSWVLRCSEHAGRVSHTNCGRRNQLHTHARDHTSALPPFLPAGAGAREPDCASVDGAASSPIAKRGSVAGARALLKSSSKGLLRLFSGSETATGLGRA